MDFYPVGVKDLTYSMSVRFCHFPEESDQPDNLFAELDHSRKMLESRPKDALVKLVKLVNLVKLVKLVKPWRLY